MRGSQKSVVKKARNEEKTKKRLYYIPLAQKKQPQKDEAAFLL